MVCWNRGLGRALKYQDKLVLSDHHKQDLWSVVSSSEYLENVGICVSTLNHFGQSNYKGFSVRQEEDWHLAVQELVRLLNMECPSHLEFTARRKGEYHYSLQPLSRMPMSRLMRLLCKDPVNLPIGMRLV